MSGWSVCFDWHEACLPSQSNRKLKLDGGLSIGSNPVEGN